MCGTGGDDIADWWNMDLRPVRSAAVSSTIINSIALELKQDNRIASETTFTRSELLVS